LLVAALGLTHSPFVGAEETVQQTGTPPRLERSELPPSAEDVSQIITELASVRDYERLYWILDAIERQVPPVRAELLKHLDDHIQQLFQAEVEARTTTALASVQPLLSPQPKESVARSVESAPLPREREEQGARPRAPWEESRAYGDLKQEIGQTQFAADSVERLKQAQQLMNQIFGVEDRQQRTELRQLVLERSEQARKQHLETLRQSIIDDLTRPAPASATGADAKVEGY